ncbi:hypothetical protein Nos7524_2101 [Nostoc sp. PCC 7524]|nr:hypothetical protein Nos7524_2101 [Nostoc sp. PCC 7524]
MINLFFEINWKNKKSTYRLALLKAVIFTLHTVDFSLIIPHPSRVIDQKY